MTSRNYAAIKSSQDNMKAIEQMAEEAMHAPTTAFKTLKDILSMAQKWNHDFANCDPGWRPPVPNNGVRQNAVALGAFVQS